MDREILFRGKRLDNGEWVGGSYMEHYYSSRFGRVSAIFANDDVLCKTYRIPVDPSTAGQYTGLTDKNGMKIFEGDIVFISEREEITDVYWRLGAWLLRFRDSDEFLSETAESCEVIGNIHNNPELIGGEDDQR